MLSKHGLSLPRKSNKDYSNSQLGVVRYITEQQLYTQLFDGCSEGTKVGLFEIHLFYYSVYFYYYS